MNEDQCKSLIGTMINRCPSCHHKNITYSQGCEECGFTWEIYCKQEFGDKVKEQCCTCGEQGKPTQIGNWCTCSCHPRVDPELWDAKRKWESI